LCNLKLFFNQEDSRIYAGRQIHPFFSLWKEGKKVQDVSESGSNLPTAKSNHKRATCGPIHVFENVKVCYFRLGALELLLLCFHVIKGVLYMCTYVRILFGF